MAQGVNDPSIRQARCSVSLRVGDSWNATDPDGSTVRVCELTKVMRGEGLSPSGGVILEIDPSPPPPQAVRKGRRLAKAVRQSLFVVDTDSVVTPDAGAPCVFVGAENRRGFTKSEARRDDVAAQRT